MPEIAWQEFDRNDRVVFKRKEFPTQESLQRFAKKLEEKANFYQFYGSR